MATAEAKASGRVPEGGATVATTMLVTNPLACLTNANMHDRHPRREHVAPRGNAHAPRRQMSGGVRISADVDHPFRLMSITHFG